MPNAPTPNMSLIVPTVGGDVNIWGGEVNTDWSLLDGLGVVPRFSVSTSGAVTPGIYPLAVYRVTTGNSNVTLTLPSAASCPGKVFTIKKVDSGTGQAILAGSIDGQSSYVCSAQYQFVTVMSNGTTYDVIGNN